MEVSRFIWNDKNIAHIGKHNVTVEEAESVTFDDDPHFRKLAKVRYAYGQTYGGRYLFIVYVLNSPGVAYVVTSREMDQAERRLYTKWKNER